MKKHPHTTRKNQDELVRLLFALGARNMSAREIQDFLGVKDDAALSRRIARLRTPDNFLLRVTTWRRSVGPFVPVYGLADGQQDAPKPVPIPVEVHRAAYKARYPERVRATHAASNKRWLHVRRERTKQRRMRESQALWGQLLPVAQLDVLK